MIWSTVLRGVFIDPAQLWKFKHKFSNFNHLITNRHLEIAVTKVSQRLSQWMDLAIKNSQWPQYSYLLQNIVIKCSNTLPQVQHQK